MCKEKPVKCIKEKDCCNFCKKLVCNYEKHLIKFHSSEKEVQKIISFPIGCCTRKDLIIELWKKCNFNRYIDYPGYPNLPNKKPVSRVRKNPRKSRRKRDDSENEILRSEITDPIIQKDLIAALKNDEIALTAKSDKLICAFAAHYIQLHELNDFIKVTANRMRALAKLLITMQVERPEITNLLEALKPIHFNLIVAATKSVVQYEEVLVTASAYAAIVKSSIKECCTVAMMEAYKANLGSQASQIKAELRTLVHLIEANWNFIPKVDKSELEKLKPMKIPKNRNLLPWTKEQKSVALQYFYMHVKERRIPVREECVQFRLQHLDLFRDREWRKIKVFIQNSFRKRGKRASDSNDNVT